MGARGPKAGPRLSAHRFLASSVYADELLAMEGVDAARKSDRMKAVNADEYDETYEIDSALMRDPLLTQKQRNAIRLASSRGYFTLSVADEIACALNVHPFTIWGEEYEEKVWFDMHDDDDIEQEAIVIPFPQPTPNPEPVYGLRLVA